MNRTPDESVAHVHELRPLLASLSVDIIVLPPTLAITAVVEAVEGTEIAVGAQNSHFADSGAMTGEVSVPMLRAAGVKYVLVGHSERRRSFHETDEIVSQKTAAALRNGVRPIVCVGETRTEMENGVGQVRIATQVTAAFAGVSPDSAAHVIVAYEPVWAVGTGSTASPSDANIILANVREMIAGLYDDITASCVQLLYGGGLTPENAADFGKQPNIDGVLVGAATADAETFTGIARALSNGSLSKH